MNTLKIMFHKVTFANYCQFKLVEARQIHNSNFKTFKEFKLILYKIYLLSYKCMFLIALAAYIVLTTHKNTGYFCAHGELLWPVFVRRPSSSGVCRLACVNFLAHLSTKCSSELLWSFNVRRPSSVVRPCVRPSVRQQFL